MIREAACRAMNKIGAIAPYRPTPPFTVRTRYYEAKDAQAVAERPGVRRVDDWTVEKDCGEDVDPLL